MEKDRIFEHIQKYLTTVPLILVGTGGTMPYGIPGMGKLANQLIIDLDSKYKKDKEWCKFVDKLKAGKGLEEALTDLRLRECIIDDIINVTWKLVNEYDLRLMKDWSISSTKPNLGKIIQKFYQTTQQRVNVITTNYDRCIEYACDQFGLPVNTLFNGEYFKRFKISNYKHSKQIVNVLKVHGSLDWYFETNGQVVALPLQGELLPGLKPAIITPGTSKYRRALEPPFREIIHIADDLIEKSQNYLCIGYGFNDSQIQANIISGIQTGKTIVVWTKELSSDALSLIQKNNENYIIVQALKSDDSKTQIIMPTGIEVIDEALWTQEGLLKII